MFFGDTHNNAGKVLYLWISGPVWRKKLHFKHWIVVVTNDNKVVATGHLYSI